MQSDQLTTQASNGAVPAKLTPEQEQEIQFRLKYPNPQPQRASAFIQKMLNKGNGKKYFDSGDYNMAKSRHRMNNTNGFNNLANSNNNNTNNVNINNTNNNVNINTNDVSLSPATSLNDSNNSSVNFIVVDGQTVTPNASANISTLNGINDTIITGNLPNNQQSPCLNTNAQLAASPMMSNSKSSTSLLNQSNSSTSHSLPSSISTSSLQINPANLLEISEEIGLEIPTPECLQSRKNHIVQSKLATPKLSTS